MAVITEDRPVSVYRDDSTSGTGTLLGIILLVVVVLALLYFGIPALRGATSSGTNVNVPDKIDVNLNQPK